jgi:bifunctional enzyme CysN/CysC
VRTRIEAVDTYDGPLDHAEAGLSVTIRLADDVDVSRGDMICAPDNAPTLTRELHADVAWMSDEPLRAGGRYAIKRSTNTARAIVDRVEDRLDVATLAREPGSAELGLNDIGRVTLRTSSPVAADPYAENRATGSFILIDEATNDTVGAGMITPT